METPKQKDDHLAELELLRSFEGNPIDAKLSFFAEEGLWLSGSVFVQIRVLVRICSESFFTYFVFSFFII